jgi:hypothetical protein
VCSQWVGGGNLSGGTGNGTGSDEAVCKTGCHEFGMKHGLTVYARVQARSLAPRQLDRITAGMDLTKLIVLALGRNY